MTPSFTLDKADPEAAEDPEFRKNYTIKGVTNLNKIEDLFSIAKSFK